MSHDLFAALIAFAFVTSVTPGPNNLMLMASGANYGLARTLPHLAGVALGFVFLAFMVGAGLQQAFASAPVLSVALKGLSVVYMLWLAWKIATATPPGEAAPTGRPMTFLQAVAFQWVNPKAWAMALTAVSVYAPSGSLAAVAVVALVFGAVNLPSVGVWVVLGTQLRRLLSSRRALRRFNVAMALLLVASLWPILAGQLPR